jgi:hypothetical protein
VRRVPFPVSAGSSGCLYGGRVYLHPYTNLRSTPDLCPDLGGKKEETRTDRLSVASWKDDSGGVGLGVRVNVQKAK